MKGETSGWGLDTIGDNFGGLISYVELLVTGSGRASGAASIRYPFDNKSEGAPLGNAYIFNTGLKCKSNIDGGLKDAVAYMNNIPLGNIPLISSFGTGNIQELRGLLPGIFENLSGFNPMIILNAIDISDGELCQKEMEEDSHYSLPLTNISSDGQSYEDDKAPVEFSKIYTFESLAAEIDPCLFRGDGLNPSSRKNPVTNKRCRESFTNINQNNEINNMETTIANHIDYLTKLNKDDWVIQLYYISISVLIIFIIIKVFNKHKY